jgi:hypothetical protein
MKLKRTVFGTLRHVERTVFLNALIRFKLEQLLRHGGDRTGAGGSSSRQQVNHGILKPFTRQPSHGLMNELTLSVSAHATTTPSNAG